MGRDKTTKTTESTSKQNQQFQQSAGEQELNRIELARLRKLDPSITQVQQGGLDLINELLAGFTGGDISERLSPLFEGISAEAAGGLAKRSVEQVLPQFQALGVLGSGSSQALAGKLANESLLNSAMFNVGNLQQTLGQTFGGQSAVQQPISASSQNLGNRFAGLRGISTTGSGTQTSTLSQMNPFLKSFQQSAGSSLGGFGFSQKGGFSLGGRA